jgi:hypothetical protein
MNRALFPDVLAFVYSNLHGEKAKYLIVERKKHF